MKRLTLLVGVLGLLAGCGGGKDGGSSDGDAWISFNPSAVNVALYEGESALSFELTGTARSLPTVPVTVLAVLDGSVLENPQVIEVSSLSYRLRARVRAGLSAGAHRTSIEVRVCEDDPLVCSRPYGGSPFHVPVTVNVLGDPGYPLSPPNGDFAGGTAGWELYANGGRALLGTSGGALRVDVVNGGSQYYAVQVYNTPGIALEAGKTYQLAFDAWAAAARTITVSVQENGRDLDGDGSPYDSYLPTLPTVALTTSTQHFQYTWTQPITNRKADVDFFLGGNAADVYLDNVTIVEAPAPPSWLSFAPGSLDVTVYPGEPGVTLSVTATPSGIPTSPVQVAAYASGPALDATSTHVVNSNGVYTISARTAAPLSLGGYDGTIQVRACLDAPATCAQPYGGSPFAIPVHVQAAADPGYPISPPNGDFTVDASGWTTYLDPNTTAAATLGVTNGALHINISDGGPQFYSVQVSCTPGIGVVQGVRYQLDFDAWADAARTLQVSVQENGRDLDGNGSPWNTYLADGLAPINLTTTPQHVQRIWTQSVTNRKANVDFFVGASAADVFVDNVVVSQLP